MLAKLADLAAAAAVVAVDRFVVNRFAQLVLHFVVSYIGISVVADYIVGQPVLEFGMDLVVVVNYRIAIQWDIALIRLYLQLVVIHFAVEIEVGLEAELGIEAVRMKDFEDARKLCPEVEVEPVAHFVGSAVHTNNFVVVFVNDFVAVAVHIEAGIEEKYAFVHIVAELAVEIVAVRSEAEHVAELAVVRTEVGLEVVHSDVVLEVELAVVRTEVGSEVVLEIEVVVGCTGAEERFGEFRK
jgi:hypothetical protein